MVGKWPPRGAFKNHVYAKKTDSEGVLNRAWRAIEKTVATDTSGRSVGYDIIMMSW